MNLFAIIFYLFAIVTIGSAVIMVFSKNIVHSAFALMFSLIGLAVFYVLLYADFVAATQLVVYVGGILILILFGVMLTTQGIPEKLEVLIINVWPSAILSSLIAVILFFVFTNTEWNLIQVVERTEVVPELGMLLISKFLLPFQAIGVLLLIAIIGAMLMSTQSKRLNN
ncbi:MAG: NADH-quinone oxidoreductase subunit J [Balneolales bacterium]